MIIREFEIWLIYILIVESILCYQNKLKKLLLIKQLTISYTCKFYRLIRYLAKKLSSRPCQMNLFRSIKLSFLILMSLTVIISLVIMVRQSGFNFPIVIPLHWIYKTRYSHLVDEIPLILQPWQWFIHCKCFPRSDYRLKIQHFNCKCIF